MNEKEWEDIVNFDKTTVQVDISSYLFSDSSIESASNEMFIDKVVQIKIGSQEINFTKADLLMMLLSVEISPQQYEFFVNKHKLKFDK